MRTLHEICKGCAHSIICNCSQSHVYGCLIESDKLDRVEGVCEDTDLNEVDND